MKFVLMIAAVLNVLGIVLYVVSSANQAVFVTVNGIFPRPYFWLAVTTLGDGAIAACIFYVLFRARSDLLAKGLVGAAVGFIASQGLKRFFIVPRPEHTQGFDQPFHLFVENMTVTNFSMPSGHTLTAFLLATLLFQYLKLNLVGKVLLGITICAVGVSRIALGVHWPADVLVGAGLGIFIGVGCIALPVSIKNKWSVVAIHLLYLPIAALVIYKIIL